MPSRRLDQVYASSGFATGINNPVDLLAGHGGSLWYLARNGVVARIRWNAHLEGDVNNDSATTTADVFYLINHFYAGRPAPVQGGDVDGNGQFNVDDLNYLIAYLLGRRPTPV